jgi:hypothetical protein
MKRRYLFGPASAAFADGRLQRQRRNGECLAFNADGTADLAVRPRDTWEDVCGRLAPGWRPDFIALSLAYASVPPCLWQAPVPVIGLADDWALLWHYYRRRLGRCELVLMDEAGVTTLGRAGIGHACAVTHLRVIFSSRC